TVPGFDGAVDQLAGRRAAGSARPAPGPPDVGRRGLAPASEESMDLDRTLVGGRVVDGGGARGDPGDSGGREGRREAIDEPLQAVGGRVVCRGLIDMGSDSDLSLLLCPTGDSKVHQGVTTEVVGNCGFSPGRLPKSTRERCSPCTGSSAISSTISTGGGGRTASSPRGSAWEGWD